MVNQGITVSLFFQNATLNISDVVEPTVFLLSCDISMKKML